MTDQLDGAVVQAITASVPARVKSGKNKDWTLAIWEELSLLSKKYDLRLYPQKGPYKGEYLVDFMFFDSQGPVFACESQLWSPLSDEDQNLKDIEWAFDKLRGVKAPLKLLIFEQRMDPNGQFPEPLHGRIKNYLLRYNGHQASETYLFIQFDNDRSAAFKWKPLNDGIHDEEIAFEKVK
jgi:hypothetical protein